MSRKKRKRSWKYTVYVSPEKVSKDRSCPGDRLGEIAEMMLPSCQEMQGIDKPTSIPGGFEPSVRGSEPPFRFVVSHRSGVVEQVPCSN